MDTVQDKRWGDPPYIQIPHALMDDKDGTADTILFWVALLQFATHERNVVISHADIQANSHLKGKRLQKAMQYFVDKKWLIVESHDEDSYFYRLIGPWEPMVEEEDDKSE